MGLNPGPEGSFVRPGDPADDLLRGFQRIVNASVACKERRLRRIRECAWRSDGVDGIFSSRFAPQETAFSRSATRELAPVVGPVTPTQVRELESDDALQGAETGHHRQVQDP